MKSPLPAARRQKEGKKKPEAYAAGLVKLVIQFSEIPTKEKLSLKSFACRKDSVADDDPQRIQNQIIDI